MDKLQNGGGWLQMTVTGGGWLQMIVNSSLHSPGFGVQQLSREGHGSTLLNSVPLEERTAPFHASLPDDRWCQTHSADAVHQVVCKPRLPHTRLQ